jgi:UDP-glucuronate decarboxylase
MGSLNLLDIAEKKGARILQASTSEVYGDPEVSPQPESYRGLVNTIGPRACYDEGKRAAETLFYEYNTRRGVDTRIARIFNTYGPRMDPADGRALSNFIVQALSGRPLTVYGDGRQTRSFCYVSDMLDALIALMETDSAGPAPINLGNPSEYSVLEIAEIVLDMTGASRPLVHQELPQDDPKQRRPDITRAKERLGWEPKVSLREGLALTIAYFRDELSEPQNMRDHRA